MKTEGYDHPIRVALFTVMGLSIETAVKVINERSDTELAVVMTCTGPKTRRSDAHMEVIQALWDNGLYNVDVIVSNKRSKYADLCAFYEVDLVVSMGYPWLLPADLLSDERIRLGAINFHNAPLPQLRGPNALGHAIMNGDTTFHFVIHRMEPQFDTGPILIRKEAYLGTNETFDGVFAPPELVKESFYEAIDLVKLGDPGEVQIGVPTPAPKFDKEFRWIDFSDRAIDIHNKIRAHYGARDIPKGALATIDGQVICITKSWIDLEDDQKENSRTPIRIVEAAAGTVVSRHGHAFDIQCGDQVLRILEWHIVKSM